MSLVAYNNRLNPLKQIKYRKLQLLAATEAPQTTERNYV